MHWYNGSIAEAVAHAQSKQSLFCVGIFGNDEDSNTLLASIESETVQSIVVREDVVAIRIGAETEEHRQFGAIYTNVTAPSIYCITSGGLVVETIKGPVAPEELKSKFEEAFARHREALRLGREAVTSTSVATSTAASSSSSSHNPTSAEVVPDTSNPAQQGLSLDERIERAKILASAKQKLKQEQEAEEAKRLEAERREAGKKVAELKRWQAEEETKRIAEERRKDKKEEAALRQKLREQIAQDRIDRERRNKPTSDVPAAAPKTETLPQAPPVPSNYTGLARLQFRLPDGSSHTHAFEPETTLGNVRDYLTSNVAAPPQGFSIWEAFPRREFTTTDYETSLRDLQLLPSAALLIIPAAESRILPRMDATGKIMSIISVIFLVITSPFNYIWSLIRPASGGGGGGSTLGKSSSSTSVNRRPVIPNRGGSTLGGTTQSRTNEPTPGTSGQNSTVRKRDTSSSAAGKTTDGSESFGKQDGNIHRLRTNETDSDDELGTYNGNSTQQM